MPATSPSSVALMDIGSNSVRLVLYDCNAELPLPVFNEKVLCGLAKDMDKTGRLNEKGVQMAIATIERYCHFIKAREINEVLAFATAAVRDASDGKQFLAQLKELFDLNVRILSGEEEAKYVGLGLLSGVYEADGVVADLGGGSLDMSTVMFEGVHSDTKEAKVMEPYSCPIGPLRIRSMAKQKGMKISEVIEEALEQYDLKARMKDKTFFAVGGGFRALAKIHVAKERYPLSVLQEYAVSPEEIMGTINTVLNLGPSRIALMPGVPEKRANIMPIVAKIMETMIKIGEPKEVVFSVCGVREGLLYEMLGRKIGDWDPLLAACKDIMVHVTPIGMDHWNAFGEDLFDILTPLFPDESEEDQRLRFAACQLHQIMWFEHRGYRPEGAFRWVLHSEMQAISHPERVKLASMLFFRYSNDMKATGSTEDMQTDICEPEDIEYAKKVGMAIRLVIKLVGSSPEVLEHFGLEQDGKKLVLACDADCMALINSDAKKRLERLAQIMMLKPVIRKRK